MPNSRPTFKLNIAGTLVEVTHENVPLTSLRLDPENPRIRLRMAMAGPTQASTPDELLQLMRAQSGFDALQKQVRQQGGIGDPLMVRHDGRIVEGNTRFTVLSVLSQTKVPGAAKKWGTGVPVARLPPDIPEKVIQLQMAGYHIAGKSKWRPAAQAAHIYMMLEHSNATMDEVLAATGMTEKQVQQHLAAYKFLLDEVIPELGRASAAEKQEILESKFSHALEFIKGVRLKPYREDNVVRKNVAKMIAKDEITGAEVRDLHKVLKQPDARKALEKDGYDAAKEVLRKVDPIGDSKLLRSVEKLTEELEDLDRSNLMLFSSSVEARELLQRIIGAAESVLTMTTPKGKRRA
jgi:hypothetical protein